MIYLKVLLEAVEAQDLKDKGAPIFQLIKSLGAKIFPSRPVVNYGGETTMEVIDESVPFVAPTFDDPKININRLDSVFPPSEMGSRRCVGTPWHWLRLFSQKCDAAAI